MDYVDSQGRLRMIPARWTSLAPPDPFVAASASRSWFRVEDLLALSDLVAGIAGERPPGERGGAAAGNVKEITPLL